MTRNTLDDARANPIETKRSGRRIVQTMRARTRLKLSIGRISSMQLSFLMLTLAATTLALSACDTNVGGLGDPGDGPDPTETARLWVVSPNTDLLSFVNPGSLFGANVLPNTELELGISNQVVSPKDVVVSQSGVLLIANGVGISIYENALTASGPRQADRVVAGPNSEINSPIAVAIDRPNDVLFVSENFAQNAIYVFDNVSQPNFNGDPLPDRMISTDDTSFDPEQMAFDSGDLYVVSRDEILVYANASTLDTMDAVPDRIISGPLLNDPIISIDSRGRLVVANQNDTILIWNNAAGLDGSPAPDLMLTINGAGRLEAAVIDSDDRLYAAERNDAVIYSLDSISELSSGSLNADRAIESNALLTPDRLFLFEP